MAWLLVVAIAGVATGTGITVALARGEPAVVGGNAGAILCSVLQGPGCTLAA